MQPPEHGPSCSHTYTELIFCRSSDVASGIANDFQRTAKKSTCDDNLDSRNFERLGFGLYLQQALFFGSLSIHDAEFRHGDTRPESLLVSHMPFRLSF